MNRTALHLELRNALEISDELRRHEHALGDDRLAGDLAYLEAMFSELERDVGRSHTDPLVRRGRVARTLLLTIQSIKAHRANVPMRLRGRFRLLLASTMRVVDALFDPDAPVASKPLFGVLPLLRAIPQDAHVMLDHAGYAAALLSALVARTPAARFVGANLALSGTAISKLTDQRLGSLHVVSIETHEGFDLAWAAAAIASPFVFGYAREDRAASAIQIVAGAFAITCALFTNYRAKHGVTPPRRSKGGPRIRRLPGMRQPPSENEDEGDGPTRIRRHPEVERALEGLSFATTNWGPRRPAQ